MTLKRIGKGFEFKRNQQKFSTLKLTAPKVIANNSLNWFLKGFRKGGGQTDASKNGWPQRKPRKDESGMQRRNLIKRGDLFRGFQVLKAVFGQIVLGTKNIPYAIRHNEGTADRLGREMPKENEKLLGNMLDKVML
jgi:hypothetical protein